MSLYKQAAEYSSLRVAHVCTYVEHVPEDPCRGQTKMLEHRREHVFLYCSPPYSPEKGSLAAPKA